MARPLRLELPGALYHVTSRGDGREDIFLSEPLARVCTRFNWVCHAYCQMTNHYHLVIETPDANLSLGMRQLNGVYTQRFNRSHQRVGHVFQGRFKEQARSKQGARGQKGARGQVFYYHIPHAILHPSWPVP